MMRIATWAYRGRGRRAAHLRHRSDGLGDDAVVDPACRVKGVDGLRVVDTCAFSPPCPGPNTHLMVLAIAEVMGREECLRWAGRDVERRRGVHGVRGARHLVDACVRVRSRVPIGVVGREHRECRIGTHDRHRAAQHCSRVRNRATRFPATAASMVVGSQRCSDAQPADASSVSARGERQVVLHRSTSCPEVHAPRR